MDLFAGGGCRPVYVGILATYWRLIMLSLFIIEIWHIFIHWGEYVILGVEG